MNRDFSKFAPIVLRLALSGVYLWFGFSQITKAASWTALVPSWASSFSGLSATTIVHLNGSFEIVAALLLIIGIAVRPVAALLFVHLLVIASHFGFSSPIGIRDYGLSFATLSVALFGADQLCYSKRATKVMPINN